MPASVAEAAPDVQPVDGPDPLAGDEPCAERRSPVAVADEFLNASPLVAPALGMVAGILLDGIHVVPVWVALAVFLLTGTALFRGMERRLVGHVALLVAAAAVGAPLHDLHLRRWPANHVSRYASGEPTTVRVGGTIISTPTISAGSAGTSAGYPRLPITRFVLSGRHFGGPTATNLPVNGLLNVVVCEPVLDIRAGDRIELTGRLNLIEPPSNPGSIDWRLVNQRKGILAELTCRLAAEVDVLGATVFSWRGWLDRARRRARAAMLDDTYRRDEPGSGLLAGMVLGQRSEIDPALNDAFVRSGTVHYLSVSGAHVGMLVGAIWGVGLLFGAGRRTCAGWAMLAATSYALLAQPSAPIVRAAIMTDLLCLGMLLRKPVRVANGLAASAIVLLVIQPTQAFDAGFQLSYVTLLSVIFVSPRLYYAARRAYRRIRRRDDPLLTPEMQMRLGMRSPRWRYWDVAVRGLGWYLAVGLSASAVGALLSARHFHQVQCYGWLNTILLMPLIWLVMVLGLVKTVVSMIAPLLDVPLGWILATLTDWLIALVHALAALPGAAFATPDVPSWLVLFGLGWVVLWTLQYPLRIPAPCSRVTGLLFLIAAAWTLAPPGPRPALTLNVLSVGNGMCSTIQLPDGRTLMYDVGSFPPYDLERWTVGPLFSCEHCWRVDAVFLSHANLDHYGGLAELMDRRCVACVLTTPHFEHAGEAHATSRTLLVRLRGRETLWSKVSRGDRIVGTGEAVFDVLWPPAEEVIAGDTNDTSLVLRVSWADRRILLCGDIEELAMQQLIAGADLRADVLVLPHHGSVTPVTAAFVRAVDPRYCIRSTGRRETGPALREIVAGRQYFSTAEHGAIQVRLEPGGIAVRPWLAP